jgi:hypothetical protein
MEDFLQNLILPLGRYKDAVAVLSEIFKVLAIIVGGVWTYRAFIQNRIGYPQAEARLDVEHLKMENGDLLLRITTNLKNVGQSLLPITKYHIRVQQVLPTLDFTPIVDDNENEVKWPLLDSLEKSIESGLREIEPKETDVMYFDFILSQKPDVLYLDFYLRNDKKRRRIEWRVGRQLIQPREEIGWNFSLLYKLDHD